MSYAKAPHTIVSYRRGRNRETLGRVGLLSPPEVSRLLRGRGVTGDIVVRHHAAAENGRPGKVLAVIAHKVT